MPLTQQVSETLLWNRGRHEIILCFICVRGQAGFFEVDFVFLPKVPCHEVEIEPVLE